ncbi:hypothetical protein FDP41_005288 [Naegleria fowleri]|uniref:Uncharacterized protein n=1 Tax=Naegleria fowleri TaxID=5763 RepID=A0A6A5BNW4_NAEFO|nr:uncharacterized protein FDP41_005288 [Naegleria fowleri]KAF0975961.1 hypothetical protein FDP41_005288 [Naegleria fowleri]CAG4708068.1 unnamed protein product [Naegleria fowleri]
MFESFDSSVAASDFQLPRERPSSTRSSWGLRSSTNLKEKTVKFVRGEVFRHLNLSIYTKTGLLLQVLREEFEDERLSYLLDPLTKKEVSYEELFKLEAVLVLEDADDADYMVHCYLKSLSNRSNYML